MPSCTPVANTPSSRTSTCACSASHSSTPCQTSARITDGTRARGASRLALDAGDDLDVLGQRRAAQLLAEALVDLEDAGAVGHLDLDAHGLVVARLDAHLVDRVGGDRVDVQPPGLELDARAALGHVERVGDAHDAALDGERPPARPVRDDRVHRLGDHDRALGLGVDLRQQPAELVGGEKQRVVLVVDAVDRHAHAMKQRGRRHHDLGVALAHAMVGDHRRGDAAAEEQPPQAQRDVGDDLDVDPRVIGEAEALRVDAGHVPPRLDLQVAVDRFQQLIQAPVAARGRADVDVGQRGVGGCHAPQTSEAPGVPRRPRRRRRRPSTRRSARPRRRGDGDRRAVAPPGVAREHLRAEAAQRGGRAVAGGERRRGRQRVPAAVEHAHVGGAQAQRTGQRSPACRRASARPRPGPSAAALPRDLAPPPPQPAPPTSTARLTARAQTERPDRPAGTQARPEPALSRRWPPWRPRPRAPGGRA